MQAGLFIIGFLLFAIVCVDSFRTIMAIGRGGFLTRFWTSSLWHLLLRFSRRFDKHRVLSIAGPIFTILTILVWYVLLVVGFFLMFASQSEAVVHGLTYREASLIERLYFTTTTLSTIGYGDLVPSGFPWTIGAAIGTLSATLILTTSISYLMPVLSAAVQRRHVARVIKAAGHCPELIVKNSWCGSNVGKLDGYWTDVSSAISLHTQKHFAYPVLHYYHSAEISHSSAANILNLADAIFMVGSARDREQVIPAGVVQVMLAGFREYARLTDWVRILDDRVQALVVPLPAREELRELGLEPVDEESFEQRWQDYRPLREQLLRLCLEDGWTAADLIAYRSR